MTDRKKSPALVDFSPITAAARVVFEWMKWLSPMMWLKSIFPLLRPRNALTQEEVHDKDFAAKRGRAIEAYLACWWAIEILVVIISCSSNLPSWARVSLALVVCIRVIEILQVTVNATLFDALSGRPDELVGLRARMLVLSGINYLELILGFGVIYAVNYHGLHGASNPISAFYFSVVTQLTIGYGDIYPTSWLRLVVAVQGLANLLFLVLIFGRFMASFPQIQSLFDKSRS